MDFNLTNDGDLSITQETNEEGTLINLISEVYDDNLRNQISICRIVSVTHDWFYDNVGADLEQLIGEPISVNTLRVGKDLILSSLTKNEFIDSDDIKIEDILISSNAIGYNVFIRQTYNPNIFMLFKVTLDLIKGVEIKLEGDVSVSIK